jgi:glutamyl-tRNA synthetase
MPTFGSITGRLAPSPTGGLHVGHARTFLLAWVNARRSGGRVVLRIEDLDSSRTRKGMAEAAVEDLRWLGLNWDEGPDVGGPHGPYLQSQRHALYAAALADLRAREFVYPCTCTRADIRRMASAPHAEDEEATYPGTCAHRRADQADDLERAGVAFGWRFRVPDEPIAWRDGVLGEVTRNPCKEGGDFLVGRSGGVFGYQLAVTVDDAAMEVTEVIRGDDLAASTPRQLLLYEALDLRPPGFSHLALVRDQCGRRLAKRDASIKLSTLRAAGADPARLLSRLMGSKDGTATPRALLDMEDVPWRLLAGERVVWSGSA